MNIQTLEAQIKSLIDSVCNNKKITRKKKGIEFFNFPASFDTETSSFMHEDEKCGLMYLWGYKINGIYFIGRTWDEFEYFNKRLSELLELNEKKRLIVYVHNLSFDFQFIRSHITMNKVFALKERKVCYCICNNGIEYRCSYILTNLPLSSLEPRSGIKKMVGEIDYSLIRTPKTMLIDSEMEYFKHDLDVVHDYIKDCIEDEGNNITKIPLTKTGYVRRDARKSMIGNSAQHLYSNRKLIKRLSLTSDSYDIIHKAFMGGFTHANAIHVSDVIENVKSYDFTSSYPAVIVREKFPMSKPELVKIFSKEQFEMLLDKYCCVFEIWFYNLRMKANDSPLSFSKTQCKGNYVLNNGRIARADECYTILTELDFFTMRDFYEWDYIEIGVFYRMIKDYLPKDFIETVLSWYNDKTKLKGIIGEEEKYMNAKSNLNSLYGMMVTDIVRPDYIYSNENGWEVPKKPLLDEMIDKYNKSMNRFLFYPWGVWVTAYARYYLMQAILYCDVDYIYSDTDSIKISNYHKYDIFFKKYNEWNEKKIEEVLKKQKIDSSLFRPENLKGNKKILGNWEDEGVYDCFKTLGAKRYAYIKDNHFGLVVSGLSPKLGAKYMIDKFCSADNAIINFNDGLFVESDYTGKKTHTYIDEEKSGVIYDYNGLSYQFNEKTAINLTPCEFDMSLSGSFKEFVKSIKGECINDERYIFTQKK